MSERFEPPCEQLDRIVKQIEREAYRRGFESGISSLKGIAAIVPESITKANLFQMIRRAADADAKRIEQ